MVIDRMNPGVDEQRVSQQAALGSLRIAIFAPYLHICGGGEKYIGKIAEILSQQHHVDFLAVQAVDIGNIEQRLNLDLSKVHVVPLPTSGAKGWRNGSALFRKYGQIRAISNATRNYDLFLNQETLTVIPNRAGRGIVICQIPPQMLNSSASLLANIGRIVGGNLFLDPQLRSYERVIVYSDFVARLAHTYYRRPINVLYPPVDTSQFPVFPKRDIVLSVGRFFVGTHNKKQLEMIRVFKSIHDRHPDARHWAYHLVGGIDPESEAREYADACVQEAQGYPIVFHFNSPFGELRQLYGEAKIFWHGTGMGEDADKHPERLEHFGMTTIEAMAAGCAPVVINRGGQPEIVRHNVDGFCWNTTAELYHFTCELMSNTDQCAELGLAARTRSQYFGLDQFQQRLAEVLHMSGPPPADNADLRNRQALP